MEGLEKVVEIFETIANRKSQKQKEKHNNEHAIRLPRRTNALSPRVAEANAQNQRKTGWRNVLQGWTQVKG